MQKSNWIGASIILCAVGCVLFPVFERAHNQSKQQREHGARLLAIHVEGVRPLEKGAALSISPRMKRGFRVGSSDNASYAPEWTTDGRSPVSVPIEQNSTFSFGFHHSNYHFRVQSIDQQGVRVRILNSASWFSPDATVLLPWNAVPNPS